MYQSSVRSTTGRTTKSVLAIVAILSLLVSLFAVLAQPVQADGNGSPEACLDTTEGTTGSIEGDANLVTWTAPTGEVVTGVCIKTGESAGHTGVITTNGVVLPGSCYTVAGIGTAIVTVTRTGTASPECQAISHIDVLTGSAPPPPPPPPDGGEDGGQIAIFKTMCESIGQQDTCNGRDTSLDGYMVDFNIYAGAGATGEPIETATVTLSENAEGQGNTGNGSQGRILSGELEAGTYTVCEVPVAYLLGEGGVVVDEVDLEAVPRPEAGNGGSTGGNQEQIPGTDCVIVEVKANGTAEVKFLDTVAEDVLPGELGSITIVKDADPNSAQDFAFTVTGAGLTAFSLDDDADATLSNQILFNGLVAGTYTVTEAMVAGWNLADIECGAGVTVDLAGRTANITLAAGADVQCTFTNVQQTVQPELGSITIIKDADPNSAQDFAFTVTGTGLTGFSLDDDGDATLPNRVTFDELGAGMYTVTEGMVEGWQLEELECTAGGSANLTTGTATITLAAGADVTCTFLNVESEDELPGVVEKPREGTLGGNPPLPNTAMETGSSSSLVATLLTVLMLGGMGIHAVRVEARRRR